MLIYRIGKMKENEIHPLQILSKLPFFVENLKCHKHYLQIVKENNQCERGKSTSRDMLSQQGIKDGRAGINLSCFSSNTKVKDM
jgi:hypothetical protein